MPTAESRKAAAKAAAEVPSQPSVTPPSSTAAEGGRQRRKDSKNDPEAPAESQQEDATDFEDDDFEHVRNKDGDQDSYGATVLLTIKDAQRLHRGSSANTNRIARIVFAHLILWALIGIQFYLLVQIKMMVCSPSVRAIRDLYDEYQKVMYDGHVRDSGYGFALGIGGPHGPYFRPENFEQLSGGFKGSLCQIPFSQREFLFILLLIWTLTVIGEIQCSVDHGVWLYQLPNKAIKRSVKKVPDSEEELEVVGLPTGMKIFLAVMIIPRMLIAMVLLWFGCRWLASTTDFSNLLANSVALEFVVTLNTMLYEKLMTSKNKREIENLKMRVAHAKGEGIQGPSALNYIGTLGWGCLAMVFVYMYIFRWQMVLPGYQWDVKGPCTEWAGKRYQFWRI